MWRSVWAAAAACGALIFAAPTSASADCKLRTVGEVHVDMSSGVPVAQGELNGGPVNILIDSGASLSLMVRSEAEKRGLAMERGRGVEVHAIGGGTEVLETTIKTLKIANFTATNLRLFVT